MLTVSPLKNQVKDDTVTFKLVRETTSVELLPNDLVDTLQGEKLTFCIIRGYGDDHIRCLIYNVDELAFDQGYCFPQSHEILGPDCMDYAAYKLAELFYAAYLAQQL